VRVVGKFLSTLKVSYTITPTPDSAAMNINKTTMRHRTKLGMNNFIEFLTMPAIKTALTAIRSLVNASVFARQVLSSGQKTYQYQLMQDSLEPPLDLG